jgi:glutathionyl-hydroquinone reductase
MSPSTQKRAYASAADQAVYGHYGPGRLHLSPEWNRPVYPFQGRATADGSSGFRAESGRYHLYVAWVCPYAQRAAIVRKLKRLEDVISLSYVDDERDGRWADTSYDLYPDALRPQIDKLNGWIYHDVNTGVSRVARATTEADREQERHRVVAALERLDERLAEQRFLTGDAITEADVRLWVTLARFDSDHNRAHLVSERELTDFDHLWPYARDLYRRPAFRETIEDLPGAWDAPHGRGR